MKNVCAFLVLGVSIAAFGQADLSKQTAAVNPPFKLDITANLEKEHSNVWDFTNTAETTVNAGSIVVVAIRKTNISDHEINRKAHTTDGYSGYFYDVRDSGGNMVGLIKRNDPYLRDRPGTSTGTNGNALKPGESRIDFVPLANWYEMSKPGTYTIQVSEHISNDPASDVVKSNIITIIVVDPETEADAPN